MRSQCQLNSSQQDKDTRQDEMELEASSEMETTLSLDTTLSGASTASISTDGCLVLGGDASRGSGYVTRFRIDRMEQREKLAGEIIQDECLPCCVPEAKHSGKMCIWAVFTAMPILLALHLTTLSLGAVKEALDLRVQAPVWHSALTAIEGYVALQVMITLPIKVWVDYNGLKRQRLRLEYVHDTADLHHPNLKRALWANTVLGIIFVVGSITAHICFYFLAHFGWSVLTNNICVLIIAFTSGLLSSWMEAETAGINEDQHKAVVHEMALLLAECTQTNTNTEQKQVFARSDRFLKALEDTDVFRRPNYIHVSPLTNTLVTTVEL